MRRFMVPTENDFRYLLANDKPLDNRKWLCYVHWGNRDLYVRRKNAEGWPLLVVSCEVAGRIERECRVTPVKMKHSFLYAVYANPQYKHPRRWRLLDTIDVNGKKYNRFYRIIDSIDNEEFAAAPLAEGNPPPPDVIVGDLTPKKVEFDLKAHKFSSYFLRGEPETET